MCLTIHWIANDWRLNKRILKFVSISSHKGEDLGRMVEGCLQDWGIEKVLTISLDNASSNDVIVSYLRIKISNWRNTVLQGKCLHMRCCTYYLPCCARWLEETFWFSCECSQCGAVCEIISYEVVKACVEKEKIVKEDKINYEAMMHGHDNIEMDTTRGHITNSLKYTRHACLTRFGHDTTS